jgi:deoxyhypusine synthase
MSTGEIPEAAAEAVLVRSEDMPEGTPIVKGYDFEGDFSFDRLMEAYKFIGFQASNLGLAIEEINRMITWRLSDDPVKDSEPEELKDPEARAKVRCKIFLSFTSNMISSGMRETIKYLVKNKMVDVIVTTAGGIEEDFLKCKRPHYMGDFALKGTELRKRGINRIGNLLVPNLNYCAFEDWFAPLLNTMHDEQEKDGVVWTPSKMIARMGKEIDHEDSVWYWAWKNDIPVYCPAITDGSVGDMIYFHSYKREGFLLDIAGDIRGMNDHAMKARKSGMIIIGGGLVKHHTCNANLMRNGADFSVFINTGQEYDGSDSGARPDEAISWGKIRIDAKPVKVYAEATLVFPLIVAQTFHKHHASFAERLAAREEAGAGGAVADK